MNFEKLMADVTVDQVAAKLLGFLSAAKLKVSSWFQGSSGDQMIVGVSQTVWTYANVTKQAIRGGFLELATDPGDPGDPSTEPGPGWLSAKGEGDYGTPREEASFATGYATLDNPTGAVHTFGPFDLTLQNAVTGKTYRNAESDSIYTNPDGTYTLGPNLSVVIPIVAEEVGTGSNAVAGDVSILASTLIGVTVTNVNPILGSDREPRDRYIARCRIAATATSPHGPADKYRYIATSARLDSTFGDMPSDAERVNVNRAQVTRDSATGEVDVWIAAPSGPADPSDFTIVDDLLTQWAVGDCVTYTGHNATGVTVAITYTVGCVAAPGLTAQIVKDAIAARLAVFFETIPIGGYDQTAGAGTLFLSKLRAEIGVGHPSIFSVTVAVPGGDVSLLLGRVAVLGTVTGTANFS